MPLAEPGVVPPLVAYDGVGPEDRTNGMLVHLLALLTGWIGVLIIWLVKKDQSRFVDFHGREALNFMISFFLYALGLMAVALVVGVVTLGLGMFIIFPVFIILGITQLVLEIMACLAANRGEWYRYPMIIRFIPD
jgi:uncharacterized Tic20 family protein